MYLSQHINAQTPPLQKQSALDKHLVLNLQVLDKIIPLCLDWSAVMDKGHRLCAFCFSGIWWNGLSLCFVLFLFSVVYYYFIFKWYFKWCSQGTTGQFDFKQSAHRDVFSPVQWCPGSQGLGDLWSVFSAWIFSSWHSTRLRVCTLLVPAACPWPSFTLLQFEFKFLKLKMQNTPDYVCFLQGIRACLYALYATCLLQVKFKPLSNSQVRPCAKGGNWMPVVFHSMTWEIKVGWWEKGFGFVSFLNCWPWASFWNPSPWFRRAERNYKVYQV